MTRERAAELWHIIKAYSEGKPIEHRCSTKEPWKELSLVRELQFQCPGDYRIKDEDSSKEPAT